MASKALGKEIPFAVIFRDETFILIGIEEYFLYEDGARTNKHAGYRYEVVDTVSFDKLKVKIEGQKKPLMLPDDLAKLRDNGEKVIVEFVNGVDKLYSRKDGNSWSVEDSFSAEDILLVTQE
uniref:hypothetical protein n=1 Tax=Acetatifactor sp. TaxID=1872090 RepID=UPI0040579DC3